MDTAGRERRQEQRSRCDRKRPMTRGQVMVELSRKKIKISHVQERLSLQERQQQHQSQPALHAADSFSIAEGGRETPISPPSAFASSAATPVNKHNISIVAQPPPLNLRELRVEEQSNNTESDINSDVLDSSRSEFERIYTVAEKYHHDVDGGDEDFDLDAAFIVAAAADDSLLDNLSRGRGGDKGDVSPADTIKNKSPASVCSADSVVVLMCQERVTNTAVTENSQTADKKEILNDDQVQERLSLQERQQHQSQPALHAADSFSIAEGGRETPISPPSAFASSAATPVNKHNISIVAQPPPLNLRELRVEEQSNNTESDINSDVLDSSRSEFERIYTVAEKYHHDVDGGDEDFDLDAAFIVAAAADDSLLDNLSRGRGGDKGDVSPADTIKNKSPASVCSADSVVVLMCQERVTNTAVTENSQTADKKEILNDDQLQDFTVDLEKSSAGGLGFTVVGCASTTGGRYIKAGVQDPALSDGRLRPRDRLIQDKDSASSDYDLSDTDPTWIPNDESQKDHVSDSDSSAVNEQTIPSPFPYLSVPLENPNAPSTLQRCDISSTCHSSSDKQEPEITGFTVDQSSGDGPKKKKKDKSHWCLVCGLSTTKLERHFNSFHRDESILVPLFHASRKDKKKELSKMRNLGDHRHNRKVWEEGKGEIVVKRKSAKEEKQVKDFVPCPECYGYFNSKDMYRHKCVKPCCKSSKGKVVAGRLLLPAVPGSKITRDHDEEKLREILEHVKNDPVGMIVKTDITIRELALRETRKNGFDSDRHAYIRNKLREIARLVLALRKESGNQNGQLIDFLKPDMFSTIVQATRVLCEFSKESSDFKNPSTAKKIGHTLKRCTLLMQAKAIEQNDMQLRQQCKHFIEVFDVRWNEWVSSSAARTLYRRHQNNVQRLPLSKDIQKLSSHLSQVAEDAKKDMKNASSSRDKTTARHSLCKALLSQVILFNRRRSGEVSKMKVQDFENRQLDTSDDILHSLPSFEQALSKSLQRVEIIGKTGTIVPILLTANLVDSFETLIASRQEAGIPETNNFVFSQSCFGHGDRNGHIRGSDTLKIHCQQADLQHPELITSTSLRKHVATMTQLYNLADNELDVVAQFLGHDIRTHRRYYRLPSAALQVTKVAKLLIQLEKGEITNPTSLDSVDISDDIIVDEENDDDEEDTHPQTAASQKGQGHHNFTGYPQLCGQTGSSGSLQSSGGTLSSGSLQSSGATRSPGSLQSSGARKAWSDDEVSAVLRHLESYILLGHLPGKEVIVKCLIEDKALKNRTWRNVKDFVRNRIQKNRCKD
ncbi:uncharacterized protein [Littorina saxatilis]|uniref:uncharacterized protein n=1 Tax=Littorina saxatilis TaxID=31220 RepID=UPI0038B5E24A